MSPAVIGAITMLFALTLQNARTEVETEKFAVVVDWANAAEEVTRAIAATKDVLTIFMIYLVYVS
ncbi:MAG: hypothetical protein AB1516_09860 [Pseudomonadota bacterium]